jgi:hypothetical protein
MRGIAEASLVLASLPKASGQPAHLWFSFKGAPSSMPSQVVQQGFCEEGQGISDTEAAKKQQGHRKT